VEWWRRRSNRFSPHRGRGQYHHPIMTRPARGFREFALYGVCGGILIAVLRLAEYRLLLLRYSIEIYRAIAAPVFSGRGIWLGGTITKKKPEVVEVVREVRVEGPFVQDEDRVRKLQIPPRELEILGLIAHGLSNKEIGERLFVSENTVKTHASRLFDKL